MRTGAKGYLPKHRGKRLLVPVGLKPAELRFLRSVADREGVPLSTWMRAASLTVAHSRAIHRVMDENPELAALMTVEPPPRV